MWAQRRRAPTTALVRKNDISSTFVGPLVRPATQRLVTTMRSATNAPLPINCQFACTLLARRGGALSPFSLPRSVPHAIEQRRLMVVLRVSAQHTTVACVSVEEGKHDTHLCVASCTLTKYKSHCATTRNTGRRAPSRAGRPASSYCTMQTSSVVAHLYYCCRRCKACARSAILAAMYECACFSFLLWWSSRRDAIA